MYGLVQDQLTTMSHIQVTVAWQHKGGGVQHCSKVAASLILNCGTTMHKALHIPCA